MKYMREKYENKKKKVKIAETEIYQMVDMLTETMFDMSLKLNGK